MSQTILYIMLFSLIVFGVKLCFYKCKLSSGHNNILLPVWFNKLSQNSQEVRLKEWNKQTSRIFTWAWFLEYWRGERSAFYAWFTWYFMAGIVAQVVCQFILGSVAPEVRIFLSFFFLVCFSVVAVVALVILWKCASNSLALYKYISRFVAVMPYCVLFILLVRHLTV